jgi:hypothetical protein
VAGLLDGEIGAEGILTLIVPPVDSPEGRRRARTILE